MTVLQRLRACMLTAAAVALTIAPALASDGSDQLPGVLLSRQLVENRHLHVGDEVRLATDQAGHNARTFRLAGVYEPTPDPMRFAQQAFEARLHLPDLIALNQTAAGLTASGAGTAIASINVALKSPSDASAFARDVSARLPGLTARPTSAPDERTSTFTVIEQFHLAVAIVTMLGSAVFLLALMIMMVDERRETVGTLRLLGFTRRRILAQVFAEGALIAAAGTLFGIVFGLSTERLFNMFFQWRYDTTLVFLRITPHVVLQSVLLAVPLGIVASLIASWSLLRRHPLALIRR